MFSKLALGALATVAAQDEAGTADHWAVLVAGSHTYMNYRHQADTCHAYQTLIKNGYNPDQIIHLAYDDVADAQQNPFAGKIFNKPTAAGTPGADVYEGCKIDYKGHDTTAETLYRVLQGDPSGGGPVLKSDENSKVFFYFADHGAPGLLAMPVGGYVYADKLNTVLNNMHEKKMYKEMVMYIEACESGSMFPKLDKNIGIYAMTAANARESSWGTYCHPDDKVNGKSIGSCLGDLFSVNWLENTDAATSLDSETLEEQYNVVKKETAKSHVLQFGDLAITAEPLADYQSGHDAAKADWWARMKQRGATEVYKNLPVDYEKNMFAVDSRDIALHYYYAQAMENPTPENYHALQAEIDHRMQMDETMANLFPTHLEDLKAGKEQVPNDFDCYRELIDLYEGSCGKFSSYSMKYMGLFAAECDAIRAYPEAKNVTMDKIKNVCAQE